MGNIFSQFFFIPSPTLTETNCPNQQGRVFLVTGGYAGVGFELCRILYALDATVYIAGRSSSKAEKAIATIKEASPSSNGRVEFLHLDLSNLSTIKPAVESFKAQQQRLDVLVNNAGVGLEVVDIIAHVFSPASLYKTDKIEGLQVMYPPKGSVDAQGHDLQVGTNCLGPYLLCQLLLPLLTKTAALSPTGSVRVAWAASVAVHVASPKPHGMNIEQNGCPKDAGVSDKYGQTKVGNVFLARYFARITPENGVVHVAYNPGNLRTELQRHWSGLSAWITDKIIVRPPIYGGYTELWAVLTLELTPDKSGAYVFPWGRFGSLPMGIENSIKGEDEGGSGIAAKFVQWCGKETEAFL